MSKQDQISAQEQALQNGFVSPLKSVFPWTKDKKIISAKLYDLLQRSLSPNAYYFSPNESKFQNDTISQDEISKLFTNYIVIDKNKLPENFIKLFHLDLKDPDIEQKVIRLFQKARSLKDKSWRILFVEDNIVIFRTEERLVHRQSSYLTQWEKRRSQKVTMFNTFSNIYDAIRSQYYIIQNSQEKQIACEEYQKEALSLAQSLREQWIIMVKDLEWKRKLDALIVDIWNATNYKILGACLYNLEHLTFKNPSIDANLLDWSKNKFRKRFTDLKSIVDVVSCQLQDLESILWSYENHLEMLLIQMNINRTYAVDNYLSEYRNIHAKYWDVAPFCEFYKRIQQDRANKKSSDATIDIIRNSFWVYKEEHKNKLQELKS